MVSIGVGIILGIGKYVLYIRNKAAQNRDMMELLQDSLNSLEEVLSNLGNASPEKISLDIKRKIEILIDKLSRYIYKRLRKSALTRQFSLQTERSKVKTLMNQLVLLLNGLQILYLNDSVSKLDSIGNKIDDALEKLDKIGIKLDSLVLGNAIMAGIQNLMLHISENFSKYRGQIFAIIEDKKLNDLDDFDKNRIYRCIKSYFRINKARKEGISSDQEFLKNLKISQFDLSEFKDNYISKDFIRFYLYTEKIAPHLTDHTNFQPVLSLHFLALDSGLREGDYTKGELLKIEGEILRSNLKYSVVSRSIPIAVARLSKSQTFFELIPKVGLPKIYYRVQEPIILHAQHEFIIEACSQIFEYKVKSVDLPAKILNNDKIYEDDGTLDPKLKKFVNKETPGRNIQKSFINLQYSDGSEFKIDSYSLDPNSAFSIFGHLQFINGQFCLNTVKRKNYSEFVWCLINVEEVFKLTSDTVLMIDNKRFQVVYEI